MTKGFDCATPLTFDKAKEFADQGFGFAGRYLAPPDSWKRLTHGEASVINAAGLFIISFFERYANRAVEGASSGSADGQLALKYAQEVGQPGGSVIYFCVDIDVTTTAQMDAIEAYLRAADAEIPGYECAVYGEYDVVMEMKNRGVVTKVCQTIAWSRGQRDPGANIYQGRIDVDVNDIGIDFDESNGKGGGWNMLIPQAAPEPAMSAEDANKIIGYLKATYAAVDDQESHEECRRLANELRKASGQPEE